MKSGPGCGVVVTASVRSAIEPSYRADGSSASRSAADDLRRRAGIVVELLAHDQSVAIAIDDDVRRPQPARVGRPVERDADERGVDARDARAFDAAVFDVAAAGDRERDELERP